MFKLRKIVITFEWKVKELLEVWLDIYMVTLSQF